MTACLSGTRAYWRAPVEIRVGSRGVVERAGRQTRQLSGVPIGEWDGYAVRREHAQAVYRICGETRLALFAVCDHGGDPVASKRSMVSRMLSSSMTSYSDAVIPPASRSRAAWISRGGRGMLPIGTVAIGMHSSPRGLFLFPSVRASPDCPRVAIAVVIRHGSNSLSSRHSLHLMWSFLTIAASWPVDVPALPNGSRTGTPVGAPRLTAAPRSNKLGRHACSRPSRPA